MEKELAHYMKFDGLLPNTEPIAKNDVSETKVEVQWSKSKLSFSATFWLNSAKILREITLMDS